MKNLRDLPLVYIVLTKRLPAGNKLDKARTANLLQETGAEQGAIRASKESIPSDFYKTIASAQNKVRNYFERNCFRINDKYAIPVGLYEKFMANLQPLLNEHDVRVQSLCDAVETGSIRQAYERRLGDAFDEAEMPFPNCEAVKRAFGIDVRVVADLECPAIAEALRELEAEARQEFIERAKEDQQALEEEGREEMIGYVMKEVVAYLQDLQKNADLSAEGRAPHYKTLRDKLERIAQELPAYNVSGNVQVQAAIDRVYASFRDLDADAMKESSEYRTRNKQEAGDLLTDIKGLF